MSGLDENFKKLFPDFDFQLKPFQKQVVTNVTAKSNTLCIMQTGGGKSLIYWLSGLELGGITLVISPLIALMNEQKDKLQKLGYNAVSFASDVNSKKQLNLLKEIANETETPNFIFLSPERLGNDGLLEYALKLRRKDIKLVVLDEVHCVSQWGMSFRPFYDRIPVFLDSCFGEDNWPVILGLTATLNPQEIVDICHAFKIKAEDVLRQDILMRSEIQLHVEKFPDEDTKTARLWEILSLHAGEKILVYVYRKYNKHGVEDLCRTAREKGIRAEFFHGDMDGSERAAIIKRYKENEIDVIFATNAFGMGIDIADVRVVVHYMLPESVEQYYQEIGRAARDGHGANAYLLYSDKNISVKKTHFIDSSFPNEVFLRKQYARIGNRVGLCTLDYYENEDVQKAFPYLLNYGLINIACKGLMNLRIFSEVKNHSLEDCLALTKTKDFLFTSKKSGMPLPALADLVYEAILRDEVSLKGSLQKTLFVNKTAMDIDDGIMQKILADIEQKKQYKHGLLDIFVNMLKNANAEMELHQEIAVYLGMDKHKMNCIHRTEDGNMVRSKSEVIICNMLYEHHIPYVYEEKLYYTQDKWLEPDFTITLKDGSKLYWEHLGLTGNASYDKRWMEKKSIYEQYFPNQLIFTYENGNLSNDVMEKIKNLQPLL